MYLVTGCNGQLGSELKRLLGDKADYTDRNLLDITNPEAFWRYFSNNGAI